MCCKAEHYKLPPERERETEIEKEEQYLLCPELVQQRKTKFPWYKLKSPLSIQHKTDIPKGKQTSHIYTTSPRGLYRFVIRFCTIKMKLQQHFWVSLWRTVLSAWPYCVTNSLFYSWRHKQFISLKSVCAQVKCLYSESLVLYGMGHTLRHGSFCGLIPPSEPGNYESQESMRGEKTELRWMISVHVGLTFCETIYIYIISK